jgi:hypothetical protein
MLIMYLLLLNLIKNALMSDFILVNADSQALIDS